MAAPASCEISFGPETSDADGTLLVRLGGSWTVGSSLPSVSDVLREATARGARRIRYDARELEAWDSVLLTFLLKLREWSEREHLESDASGLPQGVNRLLDLATGVPEVEGARRSARDLPLLARIGNATLELLVGGREMLAFLGESALSIVRLLTGRARFRRVDLWLTVQECGANALPIVSLISVLVGMILAFVGAVQLRQFGAGIYVADLVGLAMAREMGAMMAAIIMAGRTGAAFAAQIGTMRVNEEIDALTTSGFSPQDFLVLPRMLALAAMMPLLCIYADLLGIIGGAAVGVVMLDLSPALYWDQTVGAVSLTDLGVGIVKSVVFGVLVAVSGCLRGLQCGTSSSAVGLAATSAVVTGIVAIIVSDAFFTLIFEVLKI
jgi:phospholipid/cholesterol/gamma-HCH transport system permease protein